MRRIHSAVVAIGLGIAILGAAGMGAMGLGVVAAGPAVAQQGPGQGVNPSRDCQTVRTCNFARNGRVRGCLSSYTCRTCRMVLARCNGTGPRRCHEVVCSWGG